MRITGLAVFDDRKSGLYRDPYIEVKVDEPVQEIDQPIGHRLYSDYRLVPCGPFFAPEFKVDGEYYDGVECVENGYDIGVLNRIGLHSQQMIDLRVASEIETLDLVMPVPRLRRLLRKFNGNTWEIIVDEQAALQGLLKWRVERRDPMCYGGAIPREARCPKTVYQTVVIKSTHLPLCNVHLTNMQSKMRKHRVTPNGR
jgi:hypothetical protein